MRRSGRRETHRTPTTGVISTIECWHDRFVSGIAALGRALPAEGRATLLWPPRGARRGRLVLPLVNWDLLPSPSALPLNESQNSASCLSHRPGHQSAHNILSARGSAQPEPKRKTCWWSFGWHALHLTTNRPSARRSASCTPACPRDNPWAMGFRPMVKAYVPGLIGVKLNDIFPGSSNSIARNTKL